MCKYVEESVFTILHKERQLLSNVILLQHQYTSGAGSVKGGVKFVSSQQKRASEQIAEPTPIGSSATRKGLRKKPIDNVVMSSYQQNTSSLTRPKPKTTLTGSAPSPTSQSANQRSSRPGPTHPTHPPPPPSHSDHPMMAKRAPNSWSPSEPRQSQPAKTVLPAGTANGKAHPCGSEGGAEVAEIPMDFPREQIKLGKDIGVGDFGKVIQAEAKRLIPGQKKTAVVVKQLKEGATNEERDTFLRPVEAMK